MFKVHLQGVNAVSKEWSKDEKDGAGVILDVGNDVTEFNVKVVKVDSKGDMIVTMTDMEDNDVAWKLMMLQRLLQTEGEDMEGYDEACLMVQPGIAAAEALDDEMDVQSVSKDPLDFTAGCLHQGVQMVIMLRMVSPMEMYVCSQEMFFQLSTSITMLEEEAAKTTCLISVKIGDPVIACDEDFWYRAKVSKLMSDNLVQVELVDFASQSTLPLNQLRKALPEVMKDDVIAVFCCLDSWVGKDREMAKEKWGLKMSSLVDEYDELEVEVVGQEGGQFKVKIPKLEAKLKGETKSMADVLKERLKKK